MTFDFPAFLVLATLATGLIWLLDAMFLAHRRKLVVTEEKSVKEPVLVEYSKAFFPIILIVLILRSFIAEPFRIPSGSMMPTLLVGDFILVNKFTYGLRLPVLNRKVVELGEPKRGDIVVFKYPQNPSVDYIKRVVGVPGDRIGYKNKVLYVNGKPQEQVHGGIYQGVGSGARETGVLRNIETLGNLEHQVLINPLAPDFGYGCQVLHRGDITVPPGSYFMMGDNRDNSNDSRCWGLVPEENLVGKAFLIWMNWDSNRQGFIDWTRLGDSIE